MVNSDWYYVSEDEPKYLLTDKAPPEAIKSYNEFYGDDVVEGEGGDDWLIRR